MSAVDFLISCGVTLLVTFTLMTLAYRLLYGVWPWHVDLDDEEDRE